MQRKRIRFAVAGLGHIAEAAVLLNFQNLKQIIRANIRRSAIKLERQRILSLPRVQATKKEILKWK